MRTSHGPLRAIAIGVVVSAVALVANDGNAASAMKIASASFANGTTIPSIYTCEGKGVSPPLEWADPPNGTKSFAIIVDDPDSPDPKAPVRSWVHWVIYDLPASTRALDEAVQTLPSGAVQGKNDRHQASYAPFCPVIGQHRYFFKLYALDVVLPASLGAATKDELENAMKGHVLESAELFGVYAMRAL